MEAGAQRARGGAAEVRRQASHGHRQRQRRTRILRRRLHRRRRQRGHRVARRLGEAAEGSEGPDDDAAARGRCGAGGVCRQHARDLRVLQQLRRGLHVPHHRCARIDRLRRTDPATVQVEGRREDRRRDEPRSRGRIGPRRLAPSKKGADPADVGAVHAVAVTSDGYALRFGLEPLVEVSTRAGRRYRAAGRGRRGRRRRARASPAERS